VFKLGNLSKLLKLFGLLHRILHLLRASGGIGCECLGIRRIDLDPKV